MTFNTFVKKHGIEKEIAIYFKSWLGLDGHIRLPEREWNRLWKEFNGG